MLVQAAQSAEGGMIKNASTQGSLTYPPTPRPAGDPAAEDEAPEDDQHRAGAVYTGELVHGVREGRGKYTWPPVHAAGHGAGSGEPDASSVPGACYEGGYMAGVRQGKGAMTYPGGTRYEGAAHPTARRVFTLRQTVWWSACRLRVKVAERSRPG